jgi:hypothetical protein
MGAHADFNYSLGCGFLVFTVGSELNVDPVERSPANLPLWISTVPTREPLDLTDPGLAPTQSDFPLTILQPKSRRSDVSYHPTDPRPH